MSSPSPREGTSDVNMNNDMGQFQNQLMSVRSLQQKYLPPSSPIFIQGRENVSQQPDQGSSCLFSSQTNSHAVTHGNAVIRGKFNKFSNHHVNEKHSPVHTHNSLGFESEEEEKENNYKGQIHPDGIHSARNPMSSIRGSVHTRESNKKGSNEKAEVSGFEEQKKSGKGFEEQKTNFQKSVKKDGDGSESSGNYKGTDKGMFNTENTGVFDTMKGQRAIEVNGITIQGDTSKTDNRKGDRTAVRRNQQLSKSQKSKKQERLNVSKSDRSRSRSNSNQSAQKSSQSKQKSAQSIGEVKVLDPHNYRDESGLKPEFFEFFKSFGEPFKGKSGEKKSGPGTKTGSKKSRGDSGEKNSSFRKINSRISSPIMRSLGKASAGGRHSRRSSSLGNIRKWNSNKNSRDNTGSAESGNVKRDQQNNQNNQLDNLDWDQQNSQRDDKRDVISQDKRDLAENSLNVISKSDSVFEFPDLKVEDIDNPDEDDRILSASSQKTESNGKPRLQNQIHNEEDLNRNHHVQNEGVHQIHLVGGNGGITNHQLNEQLLNPGKKPPRSPQSKVSPESLSSWTQKQSLTQHRSLFLQPFNSQSRANNQNYNHNYNPHNTNNNNHNHHLVFGFPPDNQGHFGFPPNSNIGYPPNNPTGRLSLPSGLPTSLVSIPQSNTSANDKSIKWSLSHGHTDTLQNPSGSQQSENQSSSRRTNQYPGNHYPENHHPRNHNGLYRTVHGHEGYDSKHDGHQVHPAIRITNDGPGPTVSMLELQIQKNRMFLLEAKGMLLYINHYVERYGTIPVIRKRVKRGECEVEEEDENGEDSEEQEQHDFNLGARVIVNGKELNYYSVFKSVVKNGKEFNYYQLKPTTDYSVHPTNEEIGTTEKIDTMMIPASISKQKSHTVEKTREKIPMLPMVKEKSKEKSTEKTETIPDTSSLKTIENMGASVLSEEDTEKLRKSILARKDQLSLISSQRLVSEEKEAEENDVVMEIISDKRVTIDIVPDMFGLNREFSLKKPKTEAEKGAGDSNAVKMTDAKRADDNGKKADLKMQKADEKTTNEKTPKSGRRSPLDFIASAAATASKFLQSKAKSLLEPHPASNQKEANKKRRSKTTWEEGKENVNDTPQAKSQDNKCSSVIQQPPTNLIPIMEYLAAEKTAHEFRRDFTHWEPIDGRLHKMEGVSALMTLARAVDDIERVYNEIKRVREETQEELKRIKAEAELKALMSDSQMKISNNISNLGKFDESQLPDIEIPDMIVDNRHIDNRPCLAKPKNFKGRSGLVEDAESINLTSSGREDVLRGKREW
jgi:hypothetical protein